MKKFKRENSQTLRIGSEVVRISIERKKRKKPRPTIKPPPIPLPHEPPDDRFDSVAFPMLSN